MAEFNAGDIESRLTLDRSPFSRGLDEAKAQGEEFSRQRYVAEVDANIAQTQAKIKSVQKELNDLARQPTDIDVEVDIARAQANIRALETEIRRLAKQDATVAVDADISAAVSRLNTLKAELRTLQSPRITPDVQTAEASARLTALKQRLDELRRMRATANVDVNTAGASAKLNFFERQLDRINRMRANPNIDVKGLTHASLGMQILVASAAALSPILVPALAAGSAAALGLGAALATAAGGIGVLILGFSGVATAVSAMSAAQKEATNTSSRLASAQSSVESAVRSLASARLSAAEAARSANQRIEDAERSLTDAQVEARRAQDDLTRARVEARRELQDLTLSIEDNELAQRRANLEVREARDNMGGLGATADQLARAHSTLATAQERYSKAVADPKASTAQKLAAKVARDSAQQRLAALRASIGGTSQERQEALLSYDEALQRQKELQIQGRRLANDKKAADAGGVRGSDQVRDAEQRVADTRRDVADAQRALTEAQRAQAVQAQQSALALASAQQAVADAQRSAAEAGSQQSAAMTKLEQAMAALTPEGRSFALFLYSLEGRLIRLRKTAERGMLPGVEAGLRAMLPLFPYLVQFVDVTSRAFGFLFEEAGKALNAPFWKGFFDFINATAGPNTILFGRILGNLARAAAALIMAFEPFGNELLQWLVRATDRFADWSQELGKSEGFKAFMAFVRQNGPKVAAMLVALASAIWNIGVALAPYAGPILDFLTKLFNRIANADPDTIRSVATAIVVLFAAFKGAQLIQTAATGIASFITALGPAAPFILVAAAIAALILGIIVLTGHWDTFVGWLKRTWEAIKTYVTPGINQIVDAFNKHLKPALTDFVTAARPILNIFLKSLVPGLKFAWDTIVAIILFAIKYISGVLTFFTGIIEGDWRKALRGISQATSAIFEFIGRIIWNGIRFIARLFGVELPSFEKVWKLAWNGIRRAVSAVFNWLKKYVFEPLKLTFTKTIPDAARWLARVNDRVWDGIGRVIRWVWRTFISPVFTAIRKGASLMGDAFDNFQKGAANAWQKLKNAARKPVRFVLDTVINKGIIKGYNWLAGKLPGIKKIDPLDLPGGLARGGILPGRSSFRDGDDQLRPMRRGEGVTVSEALKDPYERQRLLTLNKFAMKGQLKKFREMGFAQGGINDKASKLVSFGRYLRKTGWTVGEHPAFGGVAPVHTSGSWHYRGGAIDVNWLPGQSAAEMRKIDALVASGLPRKYGLRTIWRYPGHFNHVHFDIGAGGDMGSFKGKTAGGGGGIAGGLAAIGGKALEAWRLVTGLKKKLENKVKGSGKWGTEVIGGLGKKMIEGAKKWISEKALGMFDFFGDGSGPGDRFRGSGPMRAAGQAWAARHGISGEVWRAMDYIITRESGWNIRAQNPTSSAHGLGQFINSTARAYNYGNTLDSQLSAFVRYTKDRYGGIIPAYNYWKKNNHYDDGGEAIGTGIMTKATLKPERVLSPRQTEDFNRLVDLLERGLLDQSRVIQTGLPDVVYLVLDDGTQLMAYVRRHARGAMADAASETADRASRGSRS